MSTTVNEPTGRGKPGLPTDEASSPTVAEQAALDEALDETFPASDPVAPHHVD